MTTRTKKNLDTLAPQARAKFVKLLEEAQRLMPVGVTVELISGTRTAAEQDALYASSRTKPGPWRTNARAGQSWHNYGVAVDLGLFKGGKYLDEKDERESTRLYGVVAKWATANGFEWGGSWSRADPPHFQLAGVLGGGSSPGPDARARYAQVGGDVSRILA